LRTLDVSRPSEPLELSSSITWDSPLALAGRGDYVYVSDRGLIAYNVSQPDAPVVLGEVHFDDTLTYDVAVTGATVFISGETEETHWLRVYDVSSPSSLREVAYIETDQLFLTLAAAGDHLFAVGSETQLFVIDVGDPSSPGEPQLLDQLGEVFDVAVEQDVAVIASGEAGFQILDMSDPTDPIQVLAVDTPEFAYRVLLANTSVLVLDVEKGVSQLRVYGLSQAVD
jgi:hypothetical protein